MVAQFGYALLCADRDLLLLCRCGAHISLFTRRAMANIVHRITHSLNYWWSCGRFRDSLQSIVMKKLMLIEQHSRSIHTRVYLQNLPIKCWPKESRPKLSNKNRVETVYLVRWGARVRSLAYFTASGWWPSATRNALALNQYTVAAERHRPSEPALVHLGHNFYRTWRWSIPRSS